MAERNRWIAMYTKHIKQKRKVYHDGFLDFHITRRKVMLYDEADNLLECRMLKTDEVVKSGETLTFQAYLVDICDPKEGSKADSSDPKVQPTSDQRCARKPFAALRPNFKKSSLRCEEKKSNPVNQFASNSHSPSHKMIRVFKKRELHKYEALSPATVNPTTKGTIPFGSADKEMITTNPMIDSPSKADSRLENDKSRKGAPSHEPIRNVNQILSFLQRQNVTATCSENLQQTSVSLMEPVSTKAASTDPPHQPFMALETSSGSTRSCLTTQVLDDLPSFDLGI